MGLFLFEIEQLTKTAQICRGRQQLYSVSKVNAQSRSDGRHLVSPFLQLGPTLLLKQVGHQIALQQNVIVTGSIKK